MPAKIKIVNAEITRVGKNFGGALKTFITFILALFLFSCDRAEEQKSTEAHHTSDSCCVKEKASSDSNAVSMRSEITCPSCGFKKMEEMPTEVCLLKYTCQKCNTTLFPREGDCCVFCTYGTHKCPSMQE
jgi:hypothetical protein